MSGPKVFDIVTRQQLFDICKAAIAEVEYAIAEWQRVMDRNMIVAPAELSRFSKNRESLLSLLAADRFVEVQALVPDLVRAIQASVLNQLAAHESETLTQQRRERSLRFSAEKLLSQAHESGVELREECVQLLVEASRGLAVDREAFQQALSHVTAALYAKEDRTLSDSQQELARALGATGEASSASETLRKAEDSLTDPRVAHVASQIADLGSNGDADLAALYRSRLDKVYEAEAVGDSRQRALLLASLEVDLATVLKKAQQLHALRHELGVEIAAAHATNDWEICSKNLRDAETALERGDQDLARLQIDQAKALRQERLKQRSAQASRAAILEGLRELGYEVREGMATQWAEKKQIVVRHAAKPGIALELAGTLDGGRLQARMVALQGTARDPHTDKQTEEKWCSEFESLQTYVARRGGQVTVVKAVAAGATPLKVVADEQHENELRHRKHDEKRLR